MRDEYALQLERAARRALDRLPERIYKRVEQEIDRLLSEPRPTGVRKLNARSPLYRLKVGDYRVIYAVFDVERIVKIINVLRRDEQTYRRLER